MSPAVPNGQTIRVFVLLLLVGVVSGRGQGVVPVPNSLFNVEGNTNSRYPFTLTSPFTMRYQQVYDASQFTTISNGTTEIQNLFSAMTNGGWISDLFFRFDGYSPVFNATVSNAEIHLSTTRSSPNNLSSVFSNNVGPDDTLVFSGSFLLGNSAPLGSPEDYFENHIVLSKFWYNPKLGNLLLDVRLYGGVGELIPPLDAVNGSGLVSKVYAHSVNDTSGTVDSVGLVTFVAMAPPPVLTVTIGNFGTSTNYVVLTWVNQPGGYHLEQSASLGANAVWNAVPGTSCDGCAILTYRIPLPSAAATAFFRVR